MNSKTSYLFIFLLILTIYSCGGSNEANEKQLKQDSIIDQTENDQDSNTQETETSETETLDSKTLALPSEKLVFGFTTDKGKTMSLSMGKDEKYLVYRFGQEGNVELQFPEDLNNSFTKFTYNYYMRGGGASNAGLDLNYVSFTGDTHKIIIFEEYSSGDPDNPKESTSIGIRIVNLKTGKETKIEGLTKSKVGTLIDFRDKDLIKVEEGEI